MAIGNTAAPPLAKTGSSVFLKVPGKGEGFA